VSVVLLLTSSSRTTKLADATFKDIVKLLTEHYQPKPSRVVQCYLFNSRGHKGESTAIYIAELKHLSEHCEFGDTLEDILCDCLVRGINDSCIQHRLLVLTTRRPMNLFWPYRGS